MIFSGFAVKKKWILLFCFFRNCFLKFISLGSTKVENYYNKTKFSYLSKFIALDDITKEFAKKNSRKLTTWYKDHYNENNIICERIPLFLIKEFVKKEKIIAYELDNKYCVNFTKFNYDLKNNGMQFSEGFFNNCTVARSVNSIYKYRKIGNLYIEIKKNNKIVCILYKILLPIILSFILFFITFGFTSVFLDIKMIYSYLIDYRLVILNILPILVFILILLFATKRYDFSFAITSFLIFIIGIINKTKLFYRDDVLKFEDITLINEAKIMLETYNIIIRWYNILSIIFCVFIILLLKKYYKKIKIKLKYRLIVIILLLFGSIYLYKNLYANDTLYNSVGNQNIINVWISTRQSQVRGLIYIL